MDIKQFTGKAGDWLKKYRYVLIVLLIGIGLMLMPDLSEQPETKAEVKAERFPDQTAELTQILSQIKGAGKVQVLLTLAAGEQTVYQTDRDMDASGSARWQTVTVTDANRNQQGIVQQILAPEYRGAVVLCQGAEDATVRLAIVEAVCDATGLTTDRVSVLKMK